MKNSKINTYVFFLLWPFGSLIANIFRYRLPVFKNIIWLFFVFYGFVIVTSLEGTDISRYAALFEYTSNLSLSNQFHYFFIQQTELDFFRAFSMMFVSLFSSSVKVYFAFIGLIFGFFYSRILGLMFERIKPPKIPSLGVYALLAYVFIFEFYAIQFVRFSTALTIFVFFVLKYYFYGNKKKWLFYSSLSILIHFAFLLPTLLFFVFESIPSKRTKVVFYAFALTSFISIFEFNVAANFIQNYVPSYIIDSKQSYLNEDYAMYISDGPVKLNWYIEYNMLLKKLFLIGTLFILFTNSKYKIIVTQYNSILNFSLLLGTVGNILSVIPQGGRFVGISYVLLYFLIAIFIINFYFLRYQTIYRQTSKFIFSFFIIVGLRYAFDSIPIEFVFGNFITSLITDSNTPLISFVKEFL